MSETKQLLLPKPHPAQYDFITSPAKFRAFVGGIGSGKTYIGCSEMVAFATANPGNLHAIVAQTYPMLRDATQRTFFQVCPEELIERFNKTRNEVKLIDGSEIIFRSADEPENLRGPTLASFFLDEAARSSKKTWHIMMGRLRAPGVDCKAWATTTPKGFNWVYEEFVKKKRDNYEIFYCKTSENPYLSPDYISALNEAYSGAFAKQELEGQFIGFEGVVYPGFSRSLHEISELPVFKKVLVGLDWGWTNEMAAAVCGIDGDDRLYVIEEFYKKQTLIEDFVKVCKGYKEKYDVTAFLCDPSEPEHITQLRREGLNAQEANNEVMPGINKVAARLDKKGDGKARFYVHEDCINTLMEFENYRYPEVKEGKAVQEKPVKLFDHLMDCVRYVCSDLDSGDRFTILTDPDSVIF